MSANTPKPPELSKEEIAERIKRTKENETAQLLIKLSGKPDIWNSLVYRQMGEEKCRKWPYNLKKITPISDEMLKEYNLALDQELVLDFQNLEFETTLDLSNFIFPKKIYFNNTNFHKYVSFNNVRFYKKTEFNHAQFHDWAVFNHVEFHQEIEFNSAQFHDDVKFCDAWFQIYVYFNHAQFHKNVNFENARFTQNTYFNSTLFHEYAKFSGTEFWGLAKFNDSKFYGITEFNDVNFCERVKFLGTKLHNNVSFQRSFFKSPPNFSGAEISAVFFEEDRTKFGNNSSGEKNAECKHAWHALIKLMDQMHNLPQRQIFHEKLLEVEEREQKNKWIKAIYKLYKETGFGYSIVKPLIVQCYSTAFFAWFYTWFLWDFKLSIKFSLSNTTPFLNLSRIVTKDVFDKINGQWYDLFIFAAAGIQSIISLFLLFLIGLALRNRFRIK